MYSIDIAHEDNSDCWDYLEPNFKFTLLESLIESTNQFVMSPSYLKLINDNKQHLLKIAARHNNINFIENYVHDVDISQFIPEAFNNLNFKCCDLLRDHKKIYQSARMYSDKDSYLFANVCRITNIESLLYAKKHFSSPVNVMRDAIKLLKLDIIKHECKSCFHIDLREIWFTNVKFIQTIHDIDPIKLSRSYDVHTIFDIDIAK
jgi:hypothetical protein